DLVEVLARRHVAQREGFTDQRRLIFAERANVLNHLDTKAALKQRGRHGGGGDALELVAGGVAEFTHLLASIDRWFADRRSKASLQKIEVPAFVGLLDML